MTDTNTDSETDKSDSETKGDTEANYQRVIDEQAVIDVAIRYTWALDFHDWDALDQVFLPDATADFMRPKLEEGIDQIKARIQRSLGPLDGSQHICGNHQVSIDGDTATHRCYMHAQHIRNGTENGSLYVVAGYYEDKMERTADGWRIRFRKLTPTWFDGNDEVIRGPKS